MSENRSATSPIVWRRSSRCSSGACVEVAMAGDTVYIRDSKQEDGPTLQFDASEWEAFRLGVIAGDFTLGRA